MSSLSSLFFASLISLFQPPLVSGSHPCQPLIVPPPTPRGSDTSYEITWMGSNCQVPLFLYLLLQERFMASTLHPLHSPQPWTSSFHYLVIIWGPWHVPQPPTPYPAGSASTGREGKGLLLGPDARTWRPSPCSRPSFPQADAHLGKSQLEAREDSLGLLEQT